MRFRLLYEFGDETGNNVGRETFEVDAKDMIDAGFKALMLATEKNPKICQGKALFIENADQRDADLQAAVERGEREEKLRIDQFRRGAVYGAENAITEAEKIARWKAELKTS